MAKKKVEQEKEEVTVETVDSEIIEDTEEEEIDTTNLTVNDLLAQYNELQIQENESNAKIADLIKVIDVDDINKSIAESLQHINNTTETVEEANSTTNKALTTIQKIPFLGRFVGKTVDAIELQSIQNSSVTEAVTKLRDNIVIKKDEVLRFIENLDHEKQALEATLPQYHRIAKATQAIIDNSTKTSKEYYDALELNTFAVSNIASITEYIKDEVEPLKIFADALANKIIRVLPTLNNRLKRKLSVKAAQTVLSDLNNALGATIDLNDKVTRLVTQDVRKTQLEVIEVLKNSGISATSIEKNAKEAIAHTKKLATAINTMRNEVIKENIAINNINENMALEYKEAAKKLEYALPSTKEAITKE